MVRRVAARLLLEPALDAHYGALRKEAAGLSFIDEGLWGFEVTDADGYVLAFARVRDQ